MRLEWVIEPKDVSAVRSLIASRRGDPFVELRRQRNLGQPRPEISKPKAWMVIVGCLLTTQQKSGPGSPVKRFLDLSPFPLAYDVCVQQSALWEFAQATLSGFGGIRRSPTIAAQMATDLHRLENGHWDRLLPSAMEVGAASDYMLERSTARYIADTLDGFGPKQSRNLLQWLGVSKYEIPIDSRITRWMNRELLAFRLNANMLSDPTYYDLVSDGIIELCHRAGEYPCVFDAAVFSIFDKSGWDDVDLAAETLRGA